MEPATYFIEMDPGLANADDSRLADDLATADFVLLTVLLGRMARTQRLDGLRLAPPERGPRRDFCQYRQYQDGLVRLYYRCR